jgi:hypothetical protein
VLTRRRVPPQLDAEAIERRKPLWQALADLYLDTQSDLFVPTVISCAEEGGFSLAEVGHVLRWEVRPALYLNYLSVAGEWAGWQEDWLFEHILQQMQRKPPLLIGQNRFMPEEWVEIRRTLAEINHQARLP